MLLSSYTRGILGSITEIGSCPYIGARSKFCLVRLYSVHQTRLKLDEPYDRHEFTYRRGVPYVGFFSSRSCFRGTNEYHPLVYLPLHRSDRLQDVSQALSAPSCLFLCAQRVFCSQVLKLDPCPTFGAHSKFLYSHRPSNRYELKRSHIAVENFRMALSCRDLVSMGQMNINLRQPHPFVLTMHRDHQR